MSLNQPKVVSILGTRNATSYGQKLVENLIDDLVPHDALSLSELAHGIDLLAHKDAVKKGLQTVGVLGNSLEKSSRIKTNQPLKNAA